MKSSLSLASKCASNPEEKEANDHLIISDPSTKNAWRIPKPISSNSTKVVVLPAPSNMHSLMVYDNHSQKVHTLPMEMNTIKAIEFLNIKGPNGDGLRIYDPGYLNTAVTKSKITEIDGEKGILRYRGYPIEELAEKSTFLEVAYLLLFGELPTVQQFEEFQFEVMHHTFVCHQTLMYFIHMSLK
ncbi:hypothetical protein HMI56_003862 [Coelomomyces lativittatus]|nr:hypothetical protein HMI56_003862 [Coelomomyces lativittatus]